MTVPVKTPSAGEIIEQVVIAGDLAKLTPEQRVVHYNKVCESLGLNPLTKPFDYIVLNGKMQLYPLRACADQLRKINDVSLEILSRDEKDGILTIHVRAKMQNGRSDEDLGAVSMIYPDRMKDRDGWRDHPKAGQPLEGDDRVNAELKCITKAKRRTTLSICGLGWIDETEVETIPGAVKPKTPAPNPMISVPDKAAHADVQQNVQATDGKGNHFPHDPETGEIIDQPAQSEESAPPADAEAAADAPRAAAAKRAETEAQKIIRLDKWLASEAEKGTAALRTAWQNLESAEQELMKAAVNRRHKPRAQEVDVAGQPFN